MNNASEFKFFRSEVTALFPLEKRNDIYFSQMRDGYSATYKPEYPNGSKRDIIISDISESGAYLRGNYEMIHFHDGKAHAHYAEKLFDLRKEML